MKRMRFFILGMLALLLLAAVPATAQAALVKKGSYEYYKENGVYLKNKWKTIDGKRCYFDAKGRRLKNCSKVIGGVKYSFDKKGYMKAGLRKLKNGTKYQKANGKYIKSTWKKIGSATYYFKANGYMAKGMWVDNKYLTKTGKMAVSTWVGSKFVGANGKKVTAKSVSIAAPSAILIDYQTGKVIYQKNANQKRANASTTKIMTAILALEKSKLTDVVTFSKKATSVEPVKLYAKKGDKYYMKDLLYVMMLESYNDVAEAIGEHVAGSQKKFAAMMNKRAKELGCKNTTFVSASGLEECNYSTKTKHGTTAADLAIMTRYAMKKSLFQKIVKTKSYSYRSLNGGPSGTAYNINGFLTSVKGAVGVKTGWTTAAGSCLVGAVKSGKKTYIAVVLGNSSSYQCIADCKALTDFAKKNYK